MSDAGEAAAERSPEGADAARLSEADAPPSRAAPKRRRPRMSDAGEAAAERSPEGADAARLSEADAPPSRVAPKRQGGRE